MEQNTSTRTGLIELAIIAAILGVVFFLRQYLGFG